MTPREWGLFTLHLGDCLDVMRSLPDASVDSVVTDPPYGLAFMGKRWDYDVPAAEVWVEVLRVLKPGGHLLSFGGTRTYHRAVCAIEDGGFEVRDQIGWAFGSGFPKSHNGEWGGTALKPAWEPICMARKPLTGTVAANVLAHGTGGLNIEGCRVPTTDDLNGGAYAAERQDSASPWAALHQTSGKEFVQPVGRWPANLIHDGSDEVLAAFPQAPGQQDATGERSTGNAARFFYCAKASRADRSANNTHPTVKPTDLMRYLCRLVTPPGGLILDPFLGSGSTGKAAVLEGFRFVGIEREATYLDIAERRIATAVFGAAAFPAVA